jgi:hypothetical protein
MRKNAAVLAIAMPLIVCLSLSTAFGALYNGVKAGDWIEYSVSYSGTPIQGHDINWARMNILDTQGPLIYVNITSRYPNGTLEASAYTLNLQTGALIDDFIIPANLTVGETFRDENYGNVTLTNQGTRIYGGAPRTVLYATIGNNSYIWDQLTGVSVEGSTTTSEYTIHSVATATNMWQPTQGLSLMIAVSLAVLVIALLVVALVVFFVRRRRCSEVKAAV